MLYYLFCFTIWTVIFSAIFYKLFLGIKQGLNYVKKLHQIPCSNCIYFTGDYRLKCTINPIIALSEDAIACRDFEPQSDHQINHFQTSFVCHDCKLNQVRSLQHKTN